MSSRAVCCVRVCAERWKTRLAAAVWRRLRRPNVKLGSGSGLVCPESCVRFPPVPACPLWACKHVVSSSVELLESKFCQLYMRGGEEDIPFWLLHLLLIHMNSHLVLIHILFGIPFITICIFSSCLQSSSLVEKKNKSSLSRIRFCVLRLI